MASLVKPVISAVGGLDSIVSGLDGDNLVVGTAPANSKVSFYSGSKLLGTATAGSDGAFSYALTAANVTSLGQGKGKSITAIASNNAGNLSTRSGAKKFDVQSDPITGRTITTTIDGITNTFKDDVIYEHISGSPDTIADDIIRPLTSIPKGPPPAGSDYIQFQLGDDRIVVNNYFGGPRTQNDENIARFLMIGKNTYDKITGKLTSMTPEKVGSLIKSDSKPDIQSGIITKVTKPIKVSPKDLFDGNPIPLKTLAEYTHDTTGIRDTGGGLATIKAFEGGKYFFEGWQNTLFNPSLV